MRADDTSQADVEAWRLHVLLQAGYPLEHAEQIAATVDIDLHLAVELVRNGCDPGVAVRILA